MKRLILASTVLGCSLMSQASYATCGDPGAAYTGSICITAAVYCPRNYIELNGQLLAINSYPALYSLLGTNYGGDARVSFGVPDMRSRTPVGAGQGLGLSPVNMGTYRGLEEVSLEPINLPSMTGTLSNAYVDGSISVLGAVAQGSGDAQPSVTAGSVAGVGKAGLSSVDMYSNSATSVTASHNLTVNGSVNFNNNQYPTDNLPPQIGMRYCMLANGVYPPRS